MRKLSRVRVVQLCFASKCLLLCITEVPGQYSCTVNVGFNPLAQKRSS